MTRKTQQPEDLCTQYALGVLGGEYPAGLWVKRACQRHLDDLERSKDDDYPFWFDVEMAERIRSFAGIIRQYEGDWAGKPLEPLPWQAFVFGCVYGWKRKEDDLRRFRTALVFVPRKNGKTTMATVPALWSLLGDKEPGAECFAVATKQDQAKKLWNAAWKMAQKTPEIGIVSGTRLSTGAQLLRKRQLALENEENFSSFAPLGSDSDTLDGLNPHLVVCDELHKWKGIGGVDLYNVFKDGMGARRQPLMFVITTAGTDQSGICYEQYESAKNILDPDKPEFEGSTVFAYLAEPDPGDEKDWEDPEVWRKANPSLGTAKRIDGITDEWDEARRITTKQPAFLTSQLNIWTKVADKWLDLADWDACEDTGLTWESVAGQSCYLGLDLARVGDLSSVAFLFPPNTIRSKWALKCLHWCPDDNIEDRSKTTVPYRQWADLGWITSTEGNATDFNVILADVLERAKDLQVQLLAYDPHFSYELVQDFQEHGFECVKFGQGFTAMTAPCEEFERKIIRREIVHDGDRVLRWMVSNVVLRRNADGAVMPDKTKSADKVDGVSATMNALGVAMDKENTKASVYEERGILTL